MRAVTATVVHSSESHPWGYGAALGAATTGAAATAITPAAGTHLSRLPTKRYNEGVVSKARKRPGTPGVAGPLGRSAEAAAVTGVAGGVPVVAGVPRPRVGTHARTAAAAHSALARRTGVGYYR